MASLALLALATFWATLKKTGGGFRMPALAFTKQPSLDREIQICDRTLSKVVESKSEKKGGEGRG